MAVTLKVYRGVSPYKTGPTDPGDLGKGTYYSTSRATARSYGVVLESTITLDFPLYLDGDQAADMVAKYGTVNGDHRDEGASRLTRDMLAAGYDSLIVSGWDSSRGEFTVVVFPKESVK